MLYIIQNNVNNYRKDFYLRLFTSISIILCTVIFFFLFSIFQSVGCSSPFFSVKISNSSTHDNFSFLILLKLYGIYSIFGFSLPILPSRYVTFNIQFQETIIVYFFESEVLINVTEFIYSILSVLQKSKKCLTFLRRCSDILCNVWSPSLENGLCI